MNISSEKNTSEAYRQYPIQEDDDQAVVFILSRDGTIIDTNQNGTQLLNHSSRQQLGAAQHHISEVLPKLGEIDLLEKNEERVNPYLRFLSRIGHKFEINALNGEQYDGELYFNDINHFGEHQVLIMCKTNDQPSQFRMV